MRPTTRILHVARVSRVLGAVGCLICSASLPLCASQPGNPAAAPLRVWPPPPEQPRIAYVSSIGKPHDAGVKLSGLGRFANLLTGGDRGNEQLRKPFALALDENDNLCVTDTGAPAVCYYQRAKQKWTRWTEVSKVRFASPVGVAKRRGIFYVADSSLGAVLAFDEKPRLIHQLTNYLERPVGVAICGNKLVVADSQRHCLVCFDSAGKRLSEIGRRGAGQGEFNFPTHLAADKAGNLYVTDSLNHRVQVFDADGRFKAQIGSVGDGAGRFSRPKGVAADGFGNIYVVDALFDNIQIFDPEGRLLLNVGEPGADPGQFWLPNGIVIDRQNEIFVADCYNRRVQVLKYIGQQ